MKIDAPTNLEMRFNLNWSQNLRKRMADILLRGNKRQKLTHFLTIVICRIRVGLMSDYELASD